MTTVWRPGRIPKPAAAYHASLERDVRRGSGALVTTAAGLPVYVLRAPSSRPVPRIHLQLVPRRTRRESAPDVARFEPTQLEYDHERPPIATDPVSQVGRFRKLRTLLQFVQFIATIVWLRVTRKLDDQRAAVLTRQFFERLGGMWIKVGQLLSLRSDLMSEAMCRELASLQYQTRGFPPAVARRVIEEQLQRPIGAVFAHFDPEPIAAASIAQVHRATLLANNRAVVVKVMRPGVEKEFDRDLELLEVIVGILRSFGLFRRFQLADGLMELKAVLTEETNYQYETVNLRRMRKSLRKHGVYVPRVIASLSRKSVLVMEEVPGVLMSQYIRLRRDNPERLHRWAVLNGIDAKSVARRLSTTALRQILEDNEFHGDLHPGNIMLLTDNRLALIDFGSVGRLRHHVWTLYRHSIAALASSDYERAADIMLMLSPSIALANDKELRRDMATALREWEFASQFPAASYMDRSIAAMSERIAKVMAKHHVPLSWGIMRVGRTLSTLDASLQTLAPDANFLKLCRAYFHDRQRRLATPRGRMKALRGVMREASGFAVDAKLLLGSGLRQQALRLHGMADRVARVRTVALTLLHRGLSMLLAIMLFGAFLDTLHDYGLAGHHGPIYRLGSAVDASLPNVQSWHWVLTIAFVAFVARLLRAIRRAITKGD